MHQEVIRYKTVLVPLFRCLSLLLDIDLRLISLNRQYEYQFQKDLHLNYTLHPDIQIKCHIELKS